MSSISLCKSTLNLKYVQCHIEILNREPLVRRADYCPVLISFHLSDKGMVQGCRFQASVICRARGALFDYNMEQHNHLRSSRHEIGHLVDTGYGRERD